MKWIGANLWLMRSHNTANLRPFVSLVRALFGPIKFFLGDIWLWQLIRNWHLPFNNAYYIKFAQTFCCECGWLKVTSLRSRMVVVSPKARPTSTTMWCTSRRPPYLVKVNERKGWIEVLRRTGYYPKCN